MAPRVHEHQAVWRIRRMDLDDLLARNLELAAPEEVGGEALGA